MRPFLLLLAAACNVSLLSAQTLPSPESVLGHKPGDDFYLASYDDSRDYFHKLAAASNRVKLLTVGKTTRGLDWEIAMISSPANLAKLDHYKDISRRLAQGRGLDDAQAKALAREGKAIVHIDGGLHSTEVAGAQQSHGTGMQACVGEERSRSGCHSRQRDPHAVAHAESRWAERSGGLVPPQRGHAV